MALSGFGCRRAGSSKVGWLFFYLFKECLNDGEVFM